MQSQGRPIADRPAVAGGMAFVRREGLLFRLGFQYLLAGIVIACTLPLLAISFVIAALATAAAAVLACFAGPGEDTVPDAPAAWATDQFAFENAIEGYEELIDEHTRRLP
jgi:hypothetical protein